MGIMGSQDCINAERPKVQYTLYQKHLSMPHIDGYPISVHSNEGSTQDGDDESRTWGTEVNLIKYLSGKGRIAGRTKFDIHISKNYSAVQTTSHNCRHPS